MAGGLVCKGKCDTEVLFVLRNVSRAETLDPLPFVNDVMVVMVYCNMFTFTLNIAQNNVLFWRN